MLSSLVVVQAGNNVPLKTDRTQVDNEMDGKGVHYYKVKLDDNYNGKDDLVLTIVPKDTKSDPDIFVSLKNEEPKDMDSSDFVCAMVGEDVCTIPAAELKAGKFVYIGAKCYKKCSYGISAELMAEMEILPRKDYKINVSAGVSKIFTFKNTGLGVKAITFTARSDIRDAKMNMYLSKGRDEAPSSDSMKAHEGWENGLVIKLDEASMFKVEPNETYKILFKSEIATTITFRADLVYSDLLIEEGVPFDDFVNYNDQTCYKYIVKSSDQNLRIGAYSFSGNPDIYVHPGIKPEKLEDFAFKATETSDDVLVITPDDRLKAGAKKGTYFICIRGVSNTSYRLRVVESDKNYYLEDGIAETNEVHSGMEQTFYYTEEALARNLNLTFTMSIKSGPLPMMFIKF